MVGLGIRYQIYQVTTQYMAQEKVPTLETTDKSVILFVGTEPICRCPISAEQWAYGRSSVRRVIVPRGITRLLRYAPSSSTD
jgi:hypothetical protein